MIPAEAKQRPVEAGEIRRGESLPRRLAVIGIIVEEQRQASAPVRKILDMYSHIILLRNGIPHGEGKAGVISVVINANTNELGALTGKLGMLKNVRVRSVML